MPWYPLWLNVSLVENDVENLSRYPNGAIGARKRQSRSMQIARIDKGSGVGWQ
jgi:hypothetical protein